MNRLSSRALAAVCAGVFAMALTVGGGAPADAAPASGPITEAKDVVGVWLGELSGYEEGQEVDWQYRLTVRKAKGQAGVAWEEWRDCADYEAACAAGKATGGGWSKSSRVLFAMDSDNVIHGVSKSGFILAAGDATGSTMYIVMVCADASESWGSAMATSGGTRAKPGEVWRSFAVTGSMARQPE